MSILVIWGIVFIISSRTASADNFWCGGKLVSTGLTKYEVYLLTGARWGYRMSDSPVVDGMIHGGLLDIFNHYHMGITAENVAEKFGVSRKDQDELAFRSQQNSGRAIKEGRFKDEIVPVSIPQKKGNPLVFDTDEHPRPNTTMEALAGLRPAFKKDGTVTAGNASGINDGAAAVVVMAPEKGKALGLQPLARIKSYATAGVAPEIMGTGPVPSSQAALKKAGLTAKDLDLVEANGRRAAAGGLAWEKLGLPSAQRASHRRNFYFHRCG